MGEIYKNATGIKAVEVAYKTAPDSLNEHAQRQASTTACTIRCSRSRRQREGRLRILAVCDRQAPRARPDMPTMTELGVPMDLTGWWAAMVPAGTPRPVVDKINNGSCRSWRSEETKKFLNKFGGDPYINTPERGAGACSKDIKDWGDYVQARQDRAAMIANKCAQMHSGSP